MLSMYGLQEEKLFLLAIKYKAVLMTIGFE